ncbi:hypothetical protein JV173_01295 [Acholeplasma equirhinis]|uniref:DUF2161 family putative PD-(D/E)XK-type phosphodiesterase n=1 Tax=Acholeplasma equirhinis TaxID=555393 RepID=UPI00197A7F60|nr:DUF2161 family putative PD-(D/E)XK-type phosphodiesterase [Acholeplasma equirhinis]MBN3490139.1 hypothetical protein [Acholeplasma equirhinis]
MKETDLYLPCKELLESLGFEVKAEVLHTDITAIKEGYTVIVEMKLNISLKLIYQAIDRQRFADKVYIALPTKVISSQKSNFKHFANLLKRLEIGLIAVGRKAEVLIETFGFDLKRSVTSSRKKKERLVKEFSLRKSDFNVGGSKGKKVTHYKEKVIEVAKLLYKKGQMSPKEISLETNIDDIQNILRKNYYGWFKPIKRGIYDLTELGIKEIETMIPSEEGNSYLGATPFFDDDMLN